MENQSQMELNPWHKNGRACKVHRVAELVCERQFLIQDVFPSNYRARGATSIIARTEAAGMMLLSAHQMRRPSDNFIWCRLQRQ